jgi:hypothetical protein
LALCKKAATRPLSECLESVAAPKGRNRLGKYLDSLPFPHYEQAPNQRGLLVCIEASGKRTIGRFVNRQFQAASPKKK